MGRYLKLQKDYARVFEAYKKDVLNKHNEDYYRLLKFIGKYNRIALTCYEADPSYCHRSEIAKKLDQYFSGKLPVIHL